MRKKYLKTGLILLVFVILLLVAFYLYRNRNNENLSNENVNDYHEVEEKPVENNAFENQTYYIEKNLNRYLSYQNLYPEKDKEEVVRSVNSNIDNEFYTNVVNSDLSKKHLILVNKYYKLEENYAPDLVPVESGYASYSAQMDRVAYEYFKKMVDAAKKDGIRLFSVSAYRSYGTQKLYYTSYVKNDGVEAADTYSARPGYSEHQTGLASDINVASSKKHFEDTKEYAWLQDNSYKYGFILRYPKGKEYITGYKYEPWHYRYVGEEVALFIHEHDITFEEYYAFYLDTDVE